MITEIHRKIRQLAGDPVLRRWLIGRLLGRWPGEPSFEAHRPPYLTEFLPLELEDADKNYPGAAPGQPEGRIDIRLAGEKLMLDASGSEAFFQRTFADIETLLAMHRFAWLPLMGAAADPAWVGILWQAWRSNYGEPSGDWAWHPYTAAERAVNILAFARRHGLPGDNADTVRVLAAHATVIADRLEYFGDHHTSNHLSNNGRGLYLLGLELKLDKAASLGAEILCHEFERIFSAEGVLREGSSHYQLLLTRNYAEAWLAAKRYERKEASMLKEFTLKALSAANAMTLPGGMPLIGDLSPDCSPAWLSGLLPGGTGGWLAGLVEDDVRAFLDLRRQIAPASSVALSAAGWHRLALGPFSMLAHVAPGGWSHMPGHGHQDIGGFELHYENEPVIVDPGRGSYGEEGEAAYYRSGAAHNGLMVDHASSFPPSRPYYDETFRRKIGGPVPQVEIETDTMTLVHHGFSRFPGVGAHKRCWHFAGNRLCVDDDLAGHSRHDLVRTIITPLKPRCVDGAIVLAGQQKEYRLSWQGDVNKMSIEPVTCWHSYGAGTAAHAIRMKKCVSLPWRGGFSLECL